MCDLYSVPWLFQPVIPKSESSDIPAWVHDWLFATCGLRPDRQSRPVVSLEESNRALLLLMAHHGVGVIRRTLIFQGVQLGGWKPWNALLAAGHSLANPAMD